jgi:hypothetical protein
MEVPERTIRQRMDALERANHIRSYRKVLKEDLKYGHVSILDTLLEPHEDIDSMKLFDLLLATPKRGRVKVQKILAMCRISPSKTVGGLSERQRTELIYYLRR